MNEIDDFFDEWKEELQEVEKTSFVVEEGEEYERRQYYKEYERKYKEIYCQKDVKEKVNYGCDCGCKMELNVVKQEQENHFDTTYNYEITSIFCSKCGRSYRVIGTVVSEKSIF